jgi:hypothetical protein
MYLKPITPIVALSIPLFLGLLSFRNLLVSVNTNDTLLGMGSLLLAIMTYVAIHMINKSNKKIEIGSTIRINGYFWGQNEFDLREIKGYKLKEGSNSKDHDTTLILVDQSEKEVLNISQRKYNAECWSDFISQLGSKGIVPLAVS